MPYEFSFPFNEVRMWVPIHQDAASEDRTSANYMPVGRLGTDWTPERLHTELSGIHSELAELYPTQEGRYAGVSVKSIRAALNFAWDPLRISFSVLLVAVICVLLIACVNVASLTLARASTRSREVAIRAAVGAGRGRLVRQFLT
jgi:ABC-type antimicrobial peptide transport system permease subunit